MRLQAEGAQNEVKQAMSFCTDTKSDSAELAREKEAAITELVAVAKKYAD
jgi:hypothetical protein